MNYSRRAQKAHYLIGERSQMSRVREIWVFLCMKGRCKKVKQGIGTLAFIAED